MSVASCDDGKARERASWYAGNPSTGIAAACCASAASSQAAEQRHQLAPLHVDFSRLVVTASLPRTRLP
jgi:hypothetical protein